MGYRQSQNMHQLMCRTSLNLPHAWSSTFSLPPPLTEPTTSPLAMPVQWVTPILHHISPPLPTSPFEKPGKGQNKKYGSGDSGGLKYIHGDIQVHHQDSPPFPLPRATGRTKKQQGEPAIHFMGYVQHLCHCISKISIHLNYFRGLVFQMKPWLQNPSELINLSPTMDYYIMSWFGQSSTSKKYSMNLRIIHLSNDKLRSRIFSRSTNSVRIVSTHNCNSCL